MITLSSVSASVITATGIWILVAGLTEAITEILKNVSPKMFKDKATYSLSIIIGISLSFAFRINPFGLEGWAGYTSTIATGILASRGANYLNGLLKKLNIL